VAKLGPSGAFLWVVQAGGTSDDGGGGGVAVDGVGNSYVTGRFSDTAAFGSTELTSAGESDVFVAKLDSSGEFLWAVRAGGTSGEGGAGVAVDGAGNSYVTGSFRESATFGSTMLTSADSSDVFVAKLNPSGTFLWAVRGGGASSDAGTDVAVDGAGNSYVAGYFYETATFDATTFTNAGFGGDVFVAKLDASGEFLWAASAGGERHDAGTGVAVDGAGNSYVAGDFRDSGTFGSTTITSAHRWDVFLAKLDPSGAFLWAVPAGGPWSQYCGGVAVDGDGNGYVTGLIYSTATFGSTTLTSEGESDVFVWKLSVDADDWCATARADVGTPSGVVTDRSFIATHSQDDVYEALTEEQSNGSPRRRRSTLEHIWTFDILPGQSYTFLVDAHHTVNSEGDDFAFTYSLDDISYSAPMVTVSKTADDDILQSFVFPEDIAGTVYIRVEDTDRTQGHSALDTVFVDEMCILTSLDPDAVPPAAPGNLIATPGDTVVNLDWLDNTEPDLGGYIVYRSLASGGPYSLLTGSPIWSSDYVDTGLANGTAYYYVVTAIDLAGNESADSVEAVATPQSGGSGDTMHVDSIVVSAVNIGGGWKKGQAVIVVVDDLGSPVDGAIVLGYFSGTFNESVLTGLTDATGSTTAETSDTAKGGVSVTFCVTDILHASLAYGDGEVCESN
jgi:hypothetical protein